MLPLGTLDTAAAVDEMRTAQPLDTLLATDAAPSSAGAIRVMSALAFTGVVDLGIVSVVAPTRDSEASTADSTTTPAGNGSRCTMRRRAIDDMLARSGLGHRPPPVTVRCGDVVSTISSVAHDDGAGMLAVGLHCPARRDAFRDDTTARLLRRIEVPILAIHPDARSVPRRAIVGVDFTNGSLIATRMTARIIGHGGTIVLAHVKPGHGVEWGTESLRSAYVHGLSIAFDHLCEVLAVRPDLRIQRVVLNGDPWTELENCAHKMSADLLAMGTHRTTSSRQLRLGSVTAAFLRSARRSLLVAPPHSPSDSPILHWS